MDSVPSKAQAKPEALIAACDAFRSCLERIKQDGISVVFMLGTGWIDPHPKNLPEQAAELIRCVTCLEGRELTQQTLDLLYADDFKRGVNAIKAWHFQAIASGLVQELMADEDASSFLHGTTLAADAATRLGENARRHIDKMLKMIAFYT